MAKTTLVEAFVKLAVEDSDLRRQLSQVEQDNERSAKKVGATWSRVLSPRNLFAGLVTGAAATFGRLGQLGLDHLRDLDQAQAKFRASTGASAQEAQRMGALVRKAFRENVDDVGQLTDAVVALRREMGMTPADVERNLQSFLDFAKVTGQDAASAVRSLDDVMDAWGLSAETAAPLMDRLKAVNEATGASVVDMQQALVTGSGTFQALNLSVDESIALLGKMAQAGIAPENALRGLQQAASKVKSPAEFEALIRKLGAIEDPAARARAAMELFGAKAGANLARIIGPGGIAIDDLLAKIRNSEGTVRTASREFDESFNTKAALWRKRVIDLGASIAGPLFGALSDAGPALMGLQAVLPILSGGFGLLTTKTIPALARGFSLLFTRIIPAGIIALRALAIALFTNPIGLIILGIAAAIGILAVAWQQNWFHIQDVIKRYAGPIIALIESIIDTAVRAWNWLKQVVGFSAPVAVPMTRNEALRRQAARQNTGGELGKKPGEPTATTPRIKTGGGKGGGADTNKALQEALRLHDAAAEMSRWSAERQIADLDRIKAKHARTSEERLDIELRIFRLREQTRQDEARKNEQAIEQSLEFVQRLQSAGAPHDEIVAGFQRVIARIKGMRKEDFADANGKAEALAKVQKAMADFELQARKEARDKIVALQKDVRDQIEALTLSEYEVKRHAIQREFEERKAAIEAALKLGAIATATAAKQLAEIDRARAEALKAVARDEIQTQRQRDVEIADTRRALGQGTIQDAIITRRALQAVTEDEPKRLQIEREIKDLLDEQAEAAKTLAQTAIQETDLRRELSEATIDEAIAKRQALLDDKSITLTLEEQLQLRKQIRDLLVEKAQAVVTLADAEAALTGQITREQLAGRLLLLATLKAMGAQQSILLQQQKEFNDLWKQFVEQEAGKDPITALRFAIDELLAKSFDFVSAWRSVFGDIQQALENALQALREGKSVVEALQIAGKGILEAVLKQLEAAIAKTLTEKIAGFLGRFIPGLDQLIKPEAAAAVALTTAGTSLTAAATLQTTAATALTSSGVSLNLAAQALIAAAAAQGGENVISGIFNAIGAGGGFAMGGVLRGVAIRAQHGLVAMGPTLAAIAEAPGLNELVLPLPRGLRPQDLAKAMERFENGHGGMTEGDVIINYNGPVDASSPRMIRLHAREVANAVRQARRGNHPLYREGRTRE